MASRKLESIEDVVRDTLAKMSQISDLIEEQRTAGDVELEVLIRLFAQHSLYALRVGRLLRDQQALSGDSAEDLMAAIAAALDEIAEEEGINL